jgi:hypothetical protein
MPHLIARICNPMAMGAALLLSLPLRYPHVPWPMAGLAALFLMLIPWGALIVMRRRGVVDDEHVTRREQRKPVFIAALCSIVAGFALLWALRAPAIVLAESGAILAGLCVLVLLSLRWKVSVHACTAAFVACRAAGFIPVAGVQLAVCFVVLVAWSRLKPQEHSVDQVLAGTAVGAAASLLPILAG